jgi:hypothetical protein
VCGVLAPNAMLAAERIPFVPNVLAALVFVEEANDGVVLFLDHCFEQLKSVKRFALALKEIDPRVARAVVNEREPVTIARGHETWHFMQIAVNAFKRRFRAIGHFCRERITMLLAVHTRHANVWYGVV